MTDTVVSSLLTQCHDPGDSAYKIGKPGKKLRDFCDDELLEYIRPFHRTLKGPAVVLYDDLPQSFMDHCHEIQWVKAEHSGREMAWVARYRMLEQWLSQARVDRVFFTDINDVAFCGCPFAWMDSFALPPMLWFGEEFAHFGSNDWITKDVKYCHLDVQEWYRQVPEWLGLNAGMWGGPKVDALSLVRSMNRWFDQCDHSKQWVSWEMIHLSFVAYRAFERFCTFKMQCAQSPHAGAGVTIRSRIPNPCQHGSLQARVLAHGTRVDRGPPMDWSEIPGWFDFQQLYNEAIDRANEPAVMVEVGSWLGRSTAYMAQHIKRRGRNVKFYCVDTFKGSNEPDQIRDVEAAGGDIFPIFERNMVRCGVDGIVHAMRMESTAAANHFPDKSLDFCFIDAAHDYESVKSDILSYRPKMKSGATLAGHDYQEPGVRRAVDELLPQRRVWERCWIVDKTP
jgi:hypothetical protein